MASKKEDKYEGSEYWPEFRNVTYVRALQQEDGSYLVQGSRGDQWKVDQSEFHANYKPTTPNKS
jgi:hypothetical protein